jgi:hypothetical protein
VQALLSLQRTKSHKRITDKLLLLRQHEPSIRRAQVCEGTLLLCAPHLRSIPTIVPTVV